MGYNGGISASANFFRIFDYFALVRMFDYFALILRASKLDGTAHLWKCKYAAQRIVKFIQVHVSNNV